jgi:hypothetical protein
MVNADILISMKRAGEILSFMTLMAIIQTSIFTVKTRIDGDTTKSARNLLIESFLIVLRSINYQGWQKQPLSMATILFQLAAFTVL